MIYTTKASIWTLNKILIEKKSILWLVIFVRTWMVKMTQFQFLEQFIEFWKLLEET